jgi:hypothetical protein
MLKDENDIKRFFELYTSLESWAKTHHNSFQHSEFEKNTESLNRFGWFIINMIKYSISGWNFRDGIVTFESDSFGMKIKYNIGEQRVIGDHFKKDNWFVVITRKVRLNLSNTLRKLSDKLQP